MIMSDLLSPAELDAMRKRLGSGNLLMGDLPSLLNAYESLLELLADPHAVRINMLRGTIARPFEFEHYDQRKNELEQARQKLAVAMCALNAIRNLSQQTGLTFEDQSFEATYLAVNAIKELNSQP